MTAAHHRVEHVAVVIPAADEQDTIVGCLAAVQDARDHLALVRPELGVDVVVVLDGCRDGTAGLVAGVPGVHAVTTAARSVGVARQVGSEEALRRCGVAEHAVWLAHTDADSTVPPQWLVAHVQEAERGVALVLGTVVPDLPEPVLSHWRALHVHGDDHPHIHGANLGIRADVLRRLGGWPAVACDEDVDLVRRAVALDLPVARRGGLAVWTSARSEGRAPRGFSGYLADLVAGVPRPRPAPDGVLP